MLANGRLLAPAALLLALAVYCPLFAEEDSAPARRSVSLGLVHAYPGGVTLVDLDARSGRLRFGGSCGGINGTAWYRPLLRAGYTFWQQPRSFIRFCDVLQPGHDNLTRVGFYGFLPEAYALVEAAPFIWTIDGPPDYKYFGSLTANIAIEYFFLRAHLAAGVGLAYERLIWPPDAQFGWYFEPALNAGLTLGSFTVGL